MAFDKSNIGKKCYINLSQEAGIDDSSLGKIIGYYNESNEEYYFVSIIPDGKVIKVYDSDEVNIIEENPVTPEAIIDATGNMTAEQAQQTRENLGIVGPGEMTLAAFNRYIVLGLGPNVVPVGTALTCDRTLNDVTEQIPMNVLDYDYHTPADPHIQHSCTIGMTNCYQNLAFDAPEALIKVVDGLTGGSHFFITLDHGAYGGGTGQDGIYGGTLAEGQDIPAGGYLRHTTMGVNQSSYNASQITGGKWIAYDTNFQQIGSQIDTDSDDQTGTNFGTATAQTANGNSPHVNFTSRNAYGDNRLEYSNWLQFVNASGTGWWVQKTEFDFPPSGISTLKGLLTGLDPVMLRSMMTVQIRVAIPICDGGGYKDIETKVFPLSMTEVNLGANGSVYETSFGLDDTLKTTPLSFYQGATNADRVKTLNGSARSWWLRSPIPSNSRSVRRIITDGSLYYDGFANYAYGLSAAWVIGNPYIN